MFDFDEIDWWLMALVLSMILFGLLLIAAQPGMFGAEMSTKLMPDLTDVQHLGCSCDQVGKEYRLYVFATTDDAPGGWWDRHLPDDDWHWHALLGIYSGKKARLHSMQDCDAWMRHVTKTLTARKPARQV